MPSKFEISNKASVTRARNPEIWKISKQLYPILGFYRTTQNGLESKGSGGYR